MRKLIWATMLTMLLSLAPQLGSAQTGEESWDNLQQLRAGQKIQVVDMNMKSLKGTFLTVSDEALSLQVGGDDVAIQRPDVFRVSSREKNKRLRNALLGLGIGGAAGGVGMWLAVREAQPISRFRGEYYDIAKWIFLPLGLGVGTGIGAAIPSHPTIYRATK